MADPARDLETVDADIARWYVRDGQLSESPLSGTLSEWGQSLRDRRLAAVAALEASGVHDPWPCVLRPPTEAQRQAYDDHVERLNSENERLHSALEELLDVAGRMIGGDTKLDPERWYAARDFARIVLRRGV